MRVLSEPRLKDTFRLTDEQILQTVDVLRGDAFLVPGNVNVNGASPHDPSDEKFLAAALEANANFVVSGDKHLLQLETFRGISIVTPRQFLNQLDGTLS
jgi:uncharacterized protein